MLPFRCVCGIADVGCNQRLAIKIVTCVSRKLCNIASKASTFQVRNNKNTSSEALVAKSKRLETASNISNIRRENYLQYNTTATALMSIT